MTSLLCPVIVGRAQELGSLRQHLDGGGPQTLLVCGEAGIGKSRLVAETRRLAWDRGRQVLQGTCYEPDRVVPYAPLLDLFRTHLAGNGSDGRFGALNTAGRDLAALLPGLSRHGLDVVPPAISDPGEHRLRIFHAMADGIVELAASWPLLFIIEDLHWSDETSLDFLAHLVRHTAGHPIRFVFSYRSDESHPGLAHMVADLEGQRLAAVLDLARLDRDQLETMVRAIFDLDRPFPTDVLDALFRLTDGNPLFVEETLKSLVEAGDLSVADGVRFRRSAEALHIPRTVHDAVQRRTASLSEAARRVLVAAAVSGHRFDFTLLQRLTGFDEVDLLALMKELITQQLVAEEAVDRFAFRHALTREAIYADLLGRERREIHRAIAQILSERATGEAGPPMGDLAYHTYAAGLWDSALTYSQQAGEQALAMYAPRAAVEHFARALHACHQLHMAVPPALHRSRGAAYELLGEFDGARQEYEAAEQRARATEDRKAEWHALLDLALLWSSRDYTRVEGVVLRAVEIARVMGDPLALGSSLNRLGNWYTNLERPRERLASHQEALGIFDRLDDRRGVAETLDFLGMTAAFLGDQVQSAAYYDRAIPILAEIDDRQRLVISLTMWTLQSGFYLSETTSAAGLRPSDVEARDERALQLAREMDWPAGVSFVLYERALRLGPRGEYARALEAARSALGIAEEIGHQQWVDGTLCTLGAIHLDLLDAPAARRYLERALALAREIGSLHWTRVASAFLTPTYLLQCEADRAAAVLAATLPDDAPMETVGQRLCWQARAQLALARGDATRALETVDRLIASAAPLSAQCLAPGPWKLRGEALAALGHAADAEQALEAARDAAIAQGILPLLWRIQLALSKLLHAGGRRREARLAADAARTVVGELAENVPEGPLRATFLHQTGRLMPPARPISAERRLKQQFGGLTARERDVALRIVQGKSNCVIAQEMVVTDRTVEGYVGNILNKLAFSSRAQIAAWAVETGLTASAE